MPVIVKAIKISHQFDVVMEFVEKINFRNLTFNFLHPAKNNASLEDTVPFDVSAIFIGMYLTFVFATSIVLNILVILVFNKRAGHVTHSNKFLLNLSICNLMSSLFIVPFAFVTLLLRGWIFGYVWCQMTGFFMNLVFTASTLTLVVIALDRYHAIVTPLHYPMLMTSKKCYRMLSLVWVVAVVSSIPPVAGWNKIEFKNHKMICTLKWNSEEGLDRYYNLSLVLLCFMVPLIVIVWVYTVIFKAARKNSQRTRRNNMPVFHSDVSCNGSPVRGDGRRSSTAPILGRRVSIQKLGASVWYLEEFKTAVTSILIFVTFIGCWLPYFSVIVLESTISKDYLTVPKYIETACILLAMSSSMLNPLVYVFKSNKMRRELLSVLSGKQNSPQSSFKKQRFSYTVDEIKSKTIIRALDGNFHRL